eukprot:12931815-Prorocentrum_lima.AAC.1
MAPEAVQDLRDTMESLGLKLATHKTSVVANNKELVTYISGKLDIPGKPKKSLKFLGADHSNGAKRGTPGTKPTMGKRWK